jgi:hypothetical protein
MKTCTKCNEQKTFDEFQKLSRNKDGLNTWCKKCKREYDNSHYQENPERRKYIKNNRQNASRRNAKYRYEYLLKHPCIDCGENDPIVLQFDHKDLENKLLNVANMGGYSIETIQEEINKCDVRCANCHARRTAKQFNWYSDFIF